MGRVIYKITLYFSSDHGFRWFKYHIVSRGELEGAIRKNFLFSFSIVLTLHKNFWVHTNKIRQGSLWSGCADLL